MEQENCSPCEMRAREREAARQEEEGKTAVFRNMILMYTGSAIIILLAAALALA